MVAAATVVGLGADTGSNLVVELGRAWGTGFGSGGTGGGGGYRTWAGNGGWGPTEHVSGVGMASSGQRAWGQLGASAGSSDNGRCGAWASSDLGQMTGTVGGIGRAEGGSDVGAMGRAASINGVTGESHLGWD